MGGRKHFSGSYVVLAILCIYVELLFYVALERKRVGYEWPVNGSGKARFSTNEFVRLLIKSVNSIKLCYEKAP